jgi:DNA-binding NarL/FixJ family response regulator
LPSHGAADKKKWLGVRVQWYLTPEDGDLELPVAMDAIATGAYYVSKNLWSVVLKRSAHSGTESLTDRELQVFNLIGCGTGISETAKQLGMSIKTVETHEMHIKQKLNLATTVELRKYATGSISRLCTAADQIMVK